MAGLKHFKMNMDPGLIRLNNMSFNRYKYFRWTRRTALISFNFLILVPTLLGVVAYKTEGKWDMRAKRKGDLAVEY